MFNPLHLSHRELRGLALLLVLLPIAPTALLVSSRIKTEHETYKTLREEAMAEQRFSAVVSLGRFLHNSPAPPKESSGERLLRLADYLREELDSTLFVGTDKHGHLLIGEPLPNEAASFEISGHYLGNLALSSLRFALVAPEWEPAVPIGEIASFGVVIVGLLAGWAVNRQLKINQIENDSLAMIAHELKTPVASGRVMLESLAEGTVRGEQATREYLEILLSENKRMHSLIDNFLTHAKLEGKGIAMNPGPVDLSSVIREVGNIYPPRFEKEGGKFMVVPPADGTMVLADRAAVLRILGCLLDNAIKHSSGAPEAVIHVQQRGNSTQIRVADRGPGIPQQETAKIFDKFYQVDKRLERSREGCGLGLAIARKLAKALNGGLTVTGNLGGGSCFILTLPSYQSSEAGLPDPGDSMATS